MTKHIEFKNNTGLHIARVIANKGIYWQVQDGEESYAVPKKQVTRGPWEEEEEEELTACELEAQELAAGHSSPLTQALQQIQAQAAAPKAKKEKAAPAERDPNLVTLKELCFELNVIPRIARRKLRKAVGTIGTGARWEWQKDSDELAKVRAALVAKEDPAADAAK